MNGSLIVGALQLVGNKPYNPKNRLSNENHLGQPTNTEQSIYNQQYWFLRKPVEHFNNAHVYKIKTPGNPCSKKGI